MCVKVLVEVEKYSAGTPYMEERIAIDEEQSDEESGESI